MLDDLLVLSLLSYYVKSSSFITIGSSKNREADDLLQGLANAHIPRQSVLHVANCETVHSLNGCAVSAVDKCRDICTTTCPVDELETIVQEDNDVVNEIKPNIESQCTRLNENVVSADLHPLARISVERRLLLERPLCGMPFRSCKNRYNSLVSHIKRRHRHCEKRLLGIVNRKYVMHS